MSGEAEIGMHSRTVVPIPIVLSSAIVPPRYSIARLAMARPRPDPGICPRRAPR